MNMGDANVVSVVRPVSSYRVTVVVCAAIAVLTTILSVRNVKKGVHHREYA